MDYIQFLQNLGFKRTQTTGHLIVQRDRCDYIYAWDISEYSLWYSLFLIDCVFVKLGYFVVCEHPEVAIYEQLIRENPQMAAGFGMTLASLKTQRIPKYANQVLIDTCAFSNAREVAHTDLQAMFNKNMGVQLPSPPTPPGP